MSPVPSSRPVPEEAGRRSGGTACDGGRSRDDTGSAVVEFVVLGVLLLVPLAYLVMTLARVQAASFAADSSARAAARVFTRADDEATGRAHALAAVRLGLRDQGFDDDPATAGRVTCSASPCLTPSARVSVQVTVEVSLPGLPAVLSRVAGTRVTVRSEHVAVVDAFRAGPSAPPPAPSSPAPSPAPRPGATP